MSRYAQEVSALTKALMAKVAQRVHGAVVRTVVLAGADTVNSIATMLKWTQYWYYAIAAYVVFWQACRFRIVVAALAVVVADAALLYSFDAEALLLAVTPASEVFDALRTPFVAAAVRSTAVAMFRLFVVRAATGLPRLPRLPRLPKMGRQAAAASTAPSSGDSAASGDSTVSPSHLRELQAIAADIGRTCYAMHLIALDVRTMCCAMQVQAGFKGVAPASRPAAPGNPSDPSGLTDSVTDSGTRNMEDTTVPPTLRRRGCPPLPIRRQHTDRQT